MFRFHKTTSIALVAIFILNAVRGARYFMVNLTATIAEKLEPVSGNKEDKVCSIFGKRYKTEPEPAFKVHMEMSHNQE